ncbi:hypothetical protein B0H11DRAFT_1713593 [Mycena galericulata]|nr:hypothetical protein B0H11DRAFT_1713593 [Mycena galericulata]
MSANPEVPPNPVVLTRHPSLYFEDGSIILRTVSGTLYNVYRVLLAKKSGFFAGLFDLPLAVLPGELAPPVGADYKTIQAHNVVRIFFRNETYTKSYKRYVAGQIPTLLGLCAILKLSHFLDIETGTAHAIHHLSGHPHLRPALRLYLACTYDVSDWVEGAFTDLMKNPIHQLSDNDYLLIGSWVYKLLVRTQARVDEHRRELAFCPPRVLHATDCVRREQCEKAWREAWFGRAGGSGMVSALLDAKVPGLTLYSVMAMFQVVGMRDVCRVQTLSKIEDTPEKISAFKKEGRIVEEAVEELRAHT